MSKFLDYNPYNGTYTSTDYSAHTDEMTVNRQQDVSGLLEYTKANRNSGINDKVGDFCKYATIPVTVQVEMLKKGINMHEPDAMSDPVKLRRILKEINTNYPYLKTTNLTHNV